LGHAKNYYKHQAFQKKDLSNNKIEAVAIRVECVATANGKVPFYIFKIYHFPVVHAPALALNLQAI